MSCQVGRTCHATQPNWVGPTLFIVKIISSLRSPDLRYSQKQNDNDLCTGMQPRLKRAKVTPRRRSA